MEFTAKSAMVVMVSWNVDPLADVRFDMGLKIMADVGLNPIFSYIIKLHRLVLSMCYSHCISHCPYFRLVLHKQCVCAIPIAYPIVRMSTLRTIRSLMSPSLSI